MYKYYIIINYIESNYFSLEVDQDIFIKYINDIIGVISLQSGYKVEAIEKNDIYKYIIKYNDIIETLGYIIK